VTYSELCQIIGRLSLAWSQLDKGVETKCSTAALPKLFILRERASFSCYNVMPISTSCLPLYIKDSLKEVKVLVDWLEDGMIG
jgi:hypothetical protein